jgi:hypothetical protein
MRKVREYLLSSTHPIGRVKAVFLGRLGFGPETPTELASALVAHAAEGEVMDREPTRLRRRGARDDWSSPASVDTPLLR